MKKRYIVILIIIVVYFAVFFLLYGRENYKQSKLKTTIIVNDSSIWQLEENSWTNITNSTSEKNALNWEEFNIIIDNKNVGKYAIVYDEQWYLFDKNRKPYNYTGNLIAYQANYTMKVKDFTKQEITDFTTVNKVLEENNLSTNQEFTVSNYIDVDYDNDGVDERLYFISNAFPIDTNPSTIFSIVFAEKDNKIYQIYKSIEENRSFNGCKPYLSAIIDVNEDNRYEFILSCSRYSVETPIDMLYQFKDNEFKIIVSNQ